MNLAVEERIQNPNMPELLDANGLLERLWPEARSRPSLRWLREQQKRKAIPYIKWGRRIFFDPKQVAEVIADRLTVRPKRPETLTRQRQPVPSSSEEARLGRLASRQRGELGAPGHDGAGNQANQHS